MTAGRAPDDLWIVLTMRGIHSSKRRLESAVDPLARAELNRWLLRRTLQVVRGWLGTLGRCVFVTACGESLGVAARAGALALDQPGGALGHNHAAGIGIARVAALGGRRAMMLPCDLPLLSSQALDAFDDLWDKRCLVLAPDRHGTGTNAVIVDAAAGLEFKFGEGSLGRYDAWAREAGYAVAICTRRELGFDLDTPEDLRLWRTLQDDEQGPVTLRVPDNEPNNEEEIR